VRYALRAAIESGRTAARQFLRLARSIASVVMVLLGIAIVMNEAIVWSAARQLRGELMTDSPTSAEDIWGRYAKLEPRSLLGVGLVGVRVSLKARLTSQAERVIVAFREDESAIDEAHWRDAATALADVLHLDPGDRPVAARLRYCEAQVQRSIGEARKRQKLAAQQPLQEAVRQFEEAARLDTRWPDPYLGLARTYIYGFEDVDQAVAALREAETRGYRPNSRKLAQLADGYRSRGHRAQFAAMGIQDALQKANYLARARDDYQRAISLYASADDQENAAAVRELLAKLGGLQR